MVWDTDGRRYFKYINDDFVTVKTALVPVIETKIKQLHYEIYKKVKENHNIANGVECRECTTANIVHCCRSNGICTYKNGNCNYHNEDDPLKKERPCPKGICHHVFEELSKQHRYGKLTIKNVDFTKVCDSPWELAKCFMSTGYDKKVDAEETDLCGLLGVFINCKSMQAAVDKKLDSKDNIFCKLRDVRNEVFHSPNFAITEEQYCKYHGVLNTLLEDNKLKTQPSVQKAYWELGSALSNVVVEIFKDLRDYVRRQYNEDTFWPNSTGDPELRHSLSDFNVDKNIMKSRAYDILVQNLQRKQNMTRSGKTIKQNTKTLNKLKIEIGNTAYCKKKARLWSGAGDSDTEQGELVLYVSLRGKNLTNTNILQLIEDQLFSDRPEYMKYVVQAMTGLTTKCLILLDTDGFGDWHPAGVQEASKGTDEVAKQKLETLGLVTEQSGNN